MNRSRKQNIRVIDENLINTSLLSYSYWDSCILQNALWYGMGRWLGLFEARVGIPVDWISKKDQIPRLTRFILQSTVTMAITISETNLFSFKTEGTPIIVYKGFALHVCWQYFYSYQSC